MDHMPNIVFSLMLWYYCLHHDDRSVSLKHTMCMSRACWACVLIHNILFTQVPIPESSLSLIPAVKVTVLWKAITLNLKKLSCTLPDTTKTGWSEEEFQDAKALKDADPNKSMLCPDYPKVFNPGLFQFNSKLNNKAVWTSNAKSTSNSSIRTNTAATFSKASYLFSRRPSPLNLLPTFRTLARTSKLLLKLSSTTWKRTTNCSSPAKSLASLFTSFIYLTKI